MLLILSWAAVENASKLLFTEIKLTPELIKFPTTLNVDEHVEAPCNIDVQLINNVDKNVEGPFKFGMVGRLVIAL